MKTHIIALPLPPSVRKALQRLCFGLPGIEWVDENDFHLTLRTFPAVEGTTLLDIQDCLGKLPFTPLAVTLQGIGCNHTKANHGSLWVHAAPNEPLERLQREIHNALKVIPLKNGSLSLKPHVALGKYRSLDPKFLASYFEAHSSFYLPPFQISSMVLLSCRFTEKRVVYEVVETFGSK